MQNVSPRPTYRIGGTDDMKAIILKMCARNPGALSVLMKVAEKGLDGFGLLLHMDDMGMSGPSIWIGYKDHCGEDFDKFAACVNSRDKAMVATINERGGYAVEAGDSFDRA